jgi:hypothetical protein
MIQGLTGKSQPNIDKFYGRHNDDFKGRTEVARRFRRVMDEIDNVIGDNIATTVFTSEVYFFSLFTYLYDKMYGLASDLTKRDPKSLPRGLEQCLQTVSRNFRTEDVPLTVLDAVQRASSDIGRRRTRLKYMHDMCDGKSAG